MSFWILVPGSLMGGGASGAISGTATISLTGAGTALGAGALAGTGTITISAAGTLENTGSISGSATISLSPAAKLTGTGAISGSASIGLSGAGTLTDAVEETPAPTGASGGGTKRQRDRQYRKRRVVTITGEGGVAFGIQARGTGTVGKPPVMPVARPITGTGGVNFELDTCGEGTVEYPPFDPLRELEDLMTLNLLGVL